MLFLLIGLIIIVADQLSKLWIRANLADGEMLFRVGFFRIVHIQNTGAAFGLFRDYSFILLLVASAGMIAILVYGFIGYRHFSWLNNLPATIALGLVLGGTVGNLIDRLRDGYVTDFIDFTYWPAFNVADSAITIGAILFAYVLLHSMRAQKQ